jgi:hypothetical protein
MLATGSLKLANTGTPNKGRRLPEWSSLRLHTPKQNQKYWTRLERFTKGKEDNGTPQLV